MDDEAETYKLWKIRKTAMQMCCDRGYMVCQEELEETLETFKEHFGDKPSAKQPSRQELTLLFSHVDNPNDQLYVFFHDNPNVGVSTIKTYYNKMQKESVRRGIIIVQTALSLSAKQSLNVVAPMFIVESFLESELIVNITEHELVPEHIILTPDEKEDLLIRYNITENQLMRIQDADPICRYYGLRSGQVVKVITSSQSAGRTIRYRLVC